MKPPVQPTASPAGTPPPLRRPGQTLKVLAAALFLAFVLPLLLLAALLAWHQYRILTTWPAVDAVVTRAEVTTSTSQASRPATSYGGRFSFRYTASGRVYQSSTDLGYSSPRQPDIVRWMMQMPAGSHQRIRYDPSNPANISLITDYTPKSFAVPFTLAKWAGIIALVAGALFWLGWRAGENQGSGVGSQESGKTGV